MVLVHLLYNGQCFIFEIAQLCHLHLGYFHLLKHQLVDLIVDHSSDLEIWIQLIKAFLTSPRGPPAMFEYCPLEV